MNLPILHDDALVTTADGVSLHLSLPWIRSLPTGSLSALEVAIDGVPVSDPHVRPAGDWWFVQDRLVVDCRPPRRRGPHQVDVSFRLAIPYLPAGPGAPLELAFHDTRLLAPRTPGEGDAPEPDAAPPPVAAEVRERPNATGPLPKGWTLAASAFNWTPEVLRAERTPTEIAVAIVTEGVAPVIEVEPGQAWRSFPHPSDAEVDALRGALDAAGGEVSIVGGSLDDWAPDGRRRGDDERLAFLLPQLQAARRLGATGIRLPLGQAGAPLLERVAPLLHELDLVLYEEAQGRQTPTDPDAARAFEAVAALGDPHVRVLVDLSMLMPALPVTYVDALEASGLDRALIGRLVDGWRDPATVQVLVSALRAGSVPPQAHTLFMDMLVRFGRSDAPVLREILPLVGGFHLKFWDLDDADGRISTPIHELGAELAASGFTGTLCSEWGGHEWLDEDPTRMTRRHLELATEALATGAGSRSARG